VTVADPVEAWLEWKIYSQGRSEGTAAKYRGYVRRLEEWAREQGLSLLDLTTEQLEDFTGLQAHRMGLTPRSRRALVAAVRDFYKWARRSRIISQDPAQQIEYPRSGNKLPTAATMKTAETLLLAPDLNTFLGVRDAAIFSVLIGCGIRLSGLVRLNESNLLWVEDPDTGAERLVLKVLEKRSKERLVPAPADTRLLIRAYLGHEELENIDRTLPDGDRVLFVSTRNRGFPEHKYRGEARRLSQRSVQDMISSYGRAAGLPEDQTHPHALRHLYGTEMAEEDVDLAQIQTLLGHSRSDTTMTYIRLATRKLSQAVDRASPITRMNTPARQLARQLEKK
jgi:site-specific recombinase XerD